MKPLMRYLLQYEERVWIAKVREDDSRSLTEVFGGRSRKGSDKMINLIKPEKLKSGDKIATVSLSWGGAGEPNLLWRYEQGKRRLEELFGLRVVEMPSTLKGAEYLRKNPQARARDLMQAFEDDSIKGIFSCIGGDDSLRLLPYIDLEVIRRHPKIFLGYSDSTVTHYMCYKAGLSSFYGPALLSDFAENVVLPEYTRKWIKKALFDNTPLGIIAPATEWTSEYLPWDYTNRQKMRRFKMNTPYEILQGKGSIEGRLIGGCIEVMDWISRTELFPTIDDFQGAILFLETSEDKPSPSEVEHYMRKYGKMGILQVLHGMIIGKPYDNCYYEDYKKILLKVLRDYNREDLPLLYNVSFGHCEPKCCLPYGAKAKINCIYKNFEILESGCR